MRVGIDCRLWNESGVGRYTRNLINQLQVLDHRNTYRLFVRSKDYNNVKFEIRNSKFEITKVDIRWHTLEEQIKFPSVINKENLDLMHFPYFSVPVFYNKPYVVTIHDLILHHFPTGLASNLPIYLYKLKLLGYKFVISKAARKAEKTITVSNATKGEIIDHLKVDPSKVVVTYEGIDDKIRNSKSEIRNKFLAKPDLAPRDKTQKYFLYVGNAYPHKNLERLLEAFSLLCHLEGTKRLRDPMGISPQRLAQGRNDINLVLVGKEDYFYKRLKQKVKKMNLDKSVLFCGEVSDNELMGLYKNALTLVMPSLMEGFGLPGLEAMANKCLVLASDIPSLKEIYGNAAVYFDPHDVSDIAQKMISVLHSNDTYHYSDKNKKGLDHVKRGLQRAKMFSWEKMARETLKVYEDCVST